MRLYEYEGKKLFKNMGIPVPAGICAKDEQEILAAAQTTSYPAVIKAQVLRGGRGKAGLIKLVNNEQEAKAAAAHILPQLGENEIVLVEPKIEAVAEAYAGITIDDLKGVPVLVISRFGGVDIEENAHKEDGGIAAMDLPAAGKAEKYQFMQTAKKAGFSGPVLPKIADAAWKLYETFLRYETETAEINPLFIIEGGTEVIAGDAKVITDDYAFFRQQELEEFRNTRNSVENDVKMIYTELGGNVGVISLGASMTMMTIDTIKKLGGEPANFADIVSGASKANLKELALRVMTNSLNDPNAKAVFATFTLVAHPLRNAVEAVVEAYNEIKPTVPVIANVRAANAALLSMSLADAKDMFRENGIIWYDRLDEAIAEVVRISKG